MNAISSFDLSNCGFETPNQPDLEPLPLQTRVSSRALVDLLLPFNQHDKAEHVLPTNAFNLATGPLHHNLPFQASEPLAQLPSRHKTPSPASVDWQAIRMLSSQLEEQQQQLQQLFQQLSPPPPSPESRPTPTPKQAELEPNDVVCARGKFMYNHPGCVRFRRILRQFVPQYQGAMTRMEKSQVIGRIIDAVFVQDCEEEVRFVKLDGNGDWRVLSRQQIRDKVGHALRESIHELDRQRNSMQAQSLGRRLHQ